MNGRFHIGMGESVGAWGNRNRPLLNERSAGSSIGKIRQKRRLAVTSLGSEGFLLWLVQVSTLFVQ